VREQKPQIKKNDYSLWLRTKLKLLEDKKWSSEYQIYKKYE